MNIDYENDYDVIIRRLIRTNKVSFANFFVERKAQLQVGEALQDYRRNLKF